MTQDQALIELRDAAERGGDYIIDTDKDRLTGIVTNRANIQDYAGKCDFWISEFKNGQRRPRHVRARVIGIRRSMRGFGA